MAGTRGGGGQETLLWVQAVPVLILAQSVTGCDSEQVI